MDKNIFRIGKVSSIDYKNGMIQAVYTDKDNAVTTKLPYANFGNEYNMPRIGEHVIVAHLSNGTSRGVAFGGIWNKKNVPRESGKELYRKELSKTPGVAYLRFDDISGEYLVRAPSILIHGVDHTDLEGPEVNIAANIRTSFESPEHEAALGRVHIMGLEGEDISIQISGGMQVVMNMSDLEALIKKVKLKTLEDLELAAGKELRLENNKFSTTLTEIMERLEALENSTSVRK
ncbi:hypothetical protein D3Z60_18320 [Lachnospiraceae bacterium]|nr:hypothetical protein [Lachnospiraceae bacterium]